MSFTKRKLTRLTVNVSVYSCLASCLLFVLLVVVQGAQRYYVLSNAIYGIHVATEEQLWLWAVLAMMSALGAFSFRIYALGVADRDVKWMPSLGAQEPPQLAPHYVSSYQNQLIVIETLWFYGIAALLCLLAYAFLKVGGFSLLLSVFSGVTALAMVVINYQRRQQANLFGGVILEQVTYPCRVGEKYQLRMVVPREFQAGEFYRCGMRCFFTDPNATKNHSASEALWEDVKAAHIAPCGQGVELRVQFDIPDALPATDPGLYDWTLTLNSFDRSPELDLTFELDVLSEHLGAVGGEHAEQ